MTERICTLRTRLGFTLPQADIFGTVQRYDAAFRKTRRAVPGSRELLELLKDTVTVGIITNGFRDLQEEKIAICRISPLIDILVISEETGEKNRT
jgi:FMN phosphatase YigB (HAD superfamily)